MHLVEHLAYGLYLAALIVAPLAFGTIDPWALVLVQSCCFLSLGLFLFWTVRTGRSTIETPGLVPLLLVLLWMAIQCLPLPRALVAFLSPAAAAHFAPLAAAGQADHHFITLSLHPFATLQELFRFSAYGAVYYLTVQWLHDVKRMRQTLMVVLAVAAAISLYAIVQHYTGSDRIFWFRTFTHNHVVGTFAYKNHFAGYIELLLPLTIALFLHARPRGQQKRSMRQVALDLFNRARGGNSLFYMATAGLMVLALLLSQSRGGVACALLAVLLLFVMAKKRFSLAGLAAVMVGLLLLVATGIGRDGLKVLDQRFGVALDRDGITMNGRLNFWQNSLPMVSDYLLTGAGAGTFRVLYPHYLEHPESTLPLHAHNDYLETLAEGGLIGSVGILAFFGLLFRKSFAVFRKRRDSFVIHLFLGSFAGLMALLAHSLIELQFRMSAAVGLYVFFLLGVHCACVAIKQHRGSRYAVASGRLVGARGWGSVAGVALFSLFCAWFQFGELRALAHLPELADAEKRMGKAGYEKKADLMALEDFTFFTGLDAEQQKTMCKRAETARQSSTFNPRYAHIGSFCAELTAEDDRALALSLAAFRGNPAQPLYALRMAHLFDRQGETNHAETFYQAAMAADPTEVHSHRAYVTWLMEEGRSEEGLRHLAVAVEKLPERTAILLGALSDTDLTAEEIERALPGRFLPRLAYAAWLEKTGDTVNTQRAYDVAVSLLDREEPVRPAAYWQLLRFYQQQKNDDKILLILQSAVERWPREFGFHLHLGDLYSRQGLHRKAMEEYRTALHIKPDHVQAAERLQRAADSLEAGRLP